MNRHRRTRFLVALTVTALGLGLTACGDDDVEVARGESTVDTVEPAETTGGAGPVSSTAAPTTTAATPATAVTVAEATDVTECAASERTLEVAIEAYIATNGTFPASEAELVDVGFLREEIATHDFDPTTGAVFRAAGVDCPAPSTTSGESATGADTVTAESIYADLEASGTVEAVGGPECARELAEIGAAGFRFIEREGREPESLDELADDLDVEVERWVFDAENDTLLAVTGSGCVDLEQATAPDPAELCVADRNTMEVAVEAYIAQFGSDVLPNEADLVSAGLLFEQSDRHDVVDGEVIAAPGGGCD